MKTYDLTIISERKRYLSDLEIQYIQSLRNSGVALSDHAIASIRSKGVLSISTDGYCKEEGVDWASTIEVWAKEDNSLGINPARIGCGTTGAFDPQADIIQNAKYLNMAEILKNWDTVIGISNKYWEKVKKLYDIPVDKEKIKA